MAKLTIRDIHQKMDEIKVIGKEGLFLWGAVKSMNGVQYLSKEYPMHGISYKNGYILNLKHINPKEMLHACIRSVVDTTQLETIISECLEKEE